LLITDLGYYWLVYLAFILGRYFLMAGGTFFLLHPGFGRHWYPRNGVLPWPGVPAKSPPYRWRLIRHDIRLSVTAAVLFAFLAALMMIVYKTGHTRIYSRIDAYGWWYLAFSFGLTLVLQDTYFYFTHRLSHHPRLFRWIHQGHHRSRMPTPWTSFAFEPGEALIHGIFFVGLVLVIPLHFVTLITALLTMTLWAIATHLGAPLLVPERCSPAVYGLLQRLTRGLIGPTHHGLHHRHYRVHFGLYFTIWDRLLGTTHPGYENQAGKLSATPGYRGYRKD
jgi:lathosterol oxidase